MAKFRSKVLDIGGFVNARIIRDHTKRYGSRSIHHCAMIEAYKVYRKVFERFEIRRYESHR